MELLEPGDVTPGTGAGASAEVGSRGQCGAAEGRGSGGHAALGAGLDANKLHGIRGNRCCCADLSVKRDRFINVRMS